MNEQIEPIDLVEIHANINKLMAQTMMLAAENSKRHHIESFMVTSDIGKPNLKASNLSLGTRFYLMMAIGSFVGAAIASTLTVWLLV